MTPSYLDLLQRLESGDVEAAALVFNRYARRLIGLSRRHLDKRVRGKVDADDVVNSVIRTSCRRAAHQGSHERTVAGVALLNNVVYRRLAYHVIVRFRKRGTDSGSL